MVTSAGLSVEPIPPGGVMTEPASPWAALLGADFAKSVVYMGLALTAMAVASWAPVGAIADRLTRSSPDSHAPWDRTGALVLGAGGLAVLCVLALVYIPGLAPEINGARRWLRIPAPGLGELSIQLSELAKWGMVALLAWYGARSTGERGGRLAHPIRGLAPALLVLGLVAGFVVLEDLGTGVLIACVGCLLLVAAGARVWHFAACVPPALGLVALAIWESPYRIKRLTAFLDPYADPRGSGYHMIQSIIAVAGGEGPGRGLGHGLQKFEYLPEDTTDFLFAIICEELGIFGAGLVVAVFLTLLGAALMVVRREPNPLLRLFALGVMSTIAIQAVMNLMVVTGLGPTKGIALPLVSSGGTGWVLTAGCVGLLIAIDRRRDRVWIDPGLAPA